MDAKAQITRVEPTVQTPKPVAVRGLSRLSTFFRGKEILILGPGSVGKSKFAQYLRLATLDPEGKREMTYAVTGSPAFALDLGRGQERMLRIRRTVDTPGQVGPLQHALLVARRRPHAIIVMLDCSGDPRSMLRWLCLFCNALDSVLRKVPSVARRLQEMVVILNKRDKVGDREFTKLREAVKKVLDRYLLVVWGEERVNAIPILECISCRTERGTTLIDQAITQLTRRLAGPDVQPGTPAGPRLVVVSPAGSRPSSSRPLYGPAPIRPLYTPAPARPSYEPVPACPSREPVPTPPSPPEHPPGNSGTGFHIAGL